jgi:hypothetical protein
MQGRKRFVSAASLLFAACTLLASAVRAKPQAKAQDLETYSGCGLDGDARSPAVRALARKIHDLETRKASSW